jgi:hypothetical protein
LKIKKKIKTNKKVFFFAGTGSMAEFGKSAFSLLPI